MKVLLTGATGFIGRELGLALVRRGHQVFALTRDANKARLELPFSATVIEADLGQAPLSPSIFKDIEAVIHLAGENIGEGRWTSERKEKIRASRVSLTQNLVQSLPPGLKSFLSASAIGIYGDRQDETLTEESGKGSGFLADVCEAWENAALSVGRAIPNCRVALLRTGLVLSPFGGAFLKMLMPFQLGFGGVLSRGEQWVSWIHLQDLVDLYITVLESENRQGIYNAVAPETVTNSRWTREFIAALKVPQGPPVPAFALKTIYREMASVLLDSQKVESRRLDFFRFRFSTLQEAFLDCCEPYQGGQQVFRSQQYFPWPKEKVSDFFSRPENRHQDLPPPLQMKIASWRHSFHFEELGGGTLMTDSVYYRLPIGRLGQLLGKHWVQGDVEKMFALRRENLLKSFGTSSV